MDATRAPARVLVPPRLPGHPLVTALDLASLVPRCRPCPTVAVRHLLERHHPHLPQHSRSLKYYYSGATSGVL